VHIRLVEPGAVQTVGESVSAAGQVAAASRRPPRDASHGEGRGRWSSTTGQVLREAQHALTRELRTRRIPARRRRRFDGLMNIDTVDAEAPRSLPARDLTTTLPRRSSPTARAGGCRSSYRIERRRGARSVDADPTSVAEFARGIREYPPDPSRLIDAARCRIG